MLITFENMAKIVGINLSKGQAKRLWDELDRKAIFEKQTPPSRSRVIRITRGLIRATGHNYSSAVFRMIAGWWEMRDKPMESAAYLGKLGEALDAATRTLPTPGPLPTEREGWAWAVAAHHSTSTRSDPNHSRGHGHGKDRKKRESAAARMRRATLLRKGASE